MSEFRIVKCKKCDAALTEIVGEKLTRCIQCGYKFSIGVESANNKVTAIRNIERSPEIEKLVQKLRGLKTTRKTKSKTTGNTDKKKTPVWITVLKWYFILSFSIGILTSFFR